VRPRALAADLLRAAAIVAAATGVALALRRVWAIPDVEMLFLFGVMVVAATGGRAASYAAAALAVVLYDFFFVPPAYTLDIENARYALTFAMMFGMSAVISTLTARLREERAEAVARERRTAALLSLSRELGRADDEAAVAAVCVRSAASILGAADVVFLAARPDDALLPLGAAPEGASLAADELSVARWARSHGTPAGPGTEVLASEGVWCAPLRTWGEVLAVLAVRPAGERRLEASQRAFLEAVAHQAALVLDRVRLAEEARHSALRVEREELRSGLLSSVSHDLRTPLAAITGAGTMLRDEAALDASLRRELVETVCDEAERLERLVSNLLEMTRLESGTVEPRREWVPVDEVVGSALNRVERRLAGRSVRTALAPDLPLLSIDPVLVEQVLVNLLENAVKYTPPGSELEIRADRDGPSVTFEVADRGPGIPPGDEERIFERFHRGTHGAGIRGVGLGLPIARAIAQAHGGRLTAANRPGGGAAFRLTLPLAADAPPAVPAARPEGASP
jgi:two-component system sensor histidine kinase KdpD